LLLNNDFGLKRKAFEDLPGVVFRAVVDKDQFFVAI
jgi:hypothetical protein